MTSLSDLEFVVSSKKFTRFLKNFKIDNLLYLTVHKDRINVKNIDFKECLGVLEGDYLCENPNVSLIYLKLEYSQLINKLQGFKDQVVFSINEIHSSLKLKDPKDPSYEYTIRCEAGVKVQNYCMLDLMQNEPTIVSFVIPTEDCLNCFKIMTAVENVILFRCCKDVNSKMVQMVSKKISSIANEYLTKETLRDYIYRHNQDVFEFQIFYLSLFSNFLKEVPKVQFKVGPTYLCLSSKEDPLNEFTFKLIMPLRQII